MRAWRPNFRAFSSRLLNRRRKPTGSPSITTLSAVSTATSRPVSLISSARLSNSEDSSSRVRWAARVASRTKARVPEIIASISAMSAAILTRSSSGAPSTRKRRRVSGVRRSCAMAPTMAVRSST